MKQRRRTHALWYIVALAISLPVTAQAQIDVPYVLPRDTTSNLTVTSSSELIFVDPDPSAISGVLKLRTLVGRVSTFLLIVMIALGILMFVIAGYQFLISGGNEEKIGKAKKTIQWIIIGMVVAVLGWSIINIIVIGWGSGPKS